MASETSIFIGLIVFYTFLFGLIGFIPDETAITYTSGDSGLNETFVGTVDSLGDEGIISTFTSYINRIYSTVTGFPTIVNTLLFTPLAIFGVYWLIIFIKQFIPFLS